MRSHAAAVLLAAAVTAFQTSSTAQSVTSGVQDPAWAPDGGRIAFAASRNNHLRSNRTTPGAYASMVPLMRSNTTSVPTLVFEQTAAGEVPKLAVGCAGNAWIPVSVYNVIIGVIDGKLGAQAAIEAARFLPGRDPADPLEDGERVEIENRFPRTLLQDLIARGHKFQKIGRKGEVCYGYAAAIGVDTANHQVEGGAEPRRSHAAVPFTARITTQP